MIRCYAGFRSQTAALRGKSILDANAIFSEVVKKDPKKSKKGCSYALEFPCNHADNVKLLFDKYGISYLGIEK